ncbi:MAG: stress response protein TerZ, partial [Bacillota bacterium]
MFKVFPFNASAPWFGFLPGTGPQAPADARAHSPPGLPPPADAPGHDAAPLDP